MLAHKPTMLVAVAHAVGQPSGAFRGAGAAGGCSGMDWLRPFFLTTNFVFAITDRSKYPQRRDADWSGANLSESNLDPRNANCKRPYAEYVTLW